MKPIFTLLIIFFIHLSFSQNIAVDNLTNKGIPYVNIIVKNTTKGFYANSKGEFTINDKPNKEEFTISNYVKKDDILVFTALGYNTKEIVYRDKKELKIILLTKKAEKLNEVILNSYNKYTTETIGITKVTGIFPSTVSRGIIKIAVFIKNDNTKKYDGTIEELIFKRLEVKFNYHAITLDQYYKNTDLKGVKGIKTKVDNDLAIKVQLYSVDKKTRLPNIPLLDDNKVIRLEKDTRKLKYNISPLNIKIPKEGVFVSLEVLGVFNEKGSIEIPKNPNFFKFRISKTENTKDLVTYSKYKERSWKKTDYKGNAIFSLKVKYPMDK